MDVIGDAGIEIHADASEAERELEKLEKKRYAKIIVDLTGTLVAKARLKIFTRPRTIDVKVILNKKSIRAAMVALNRLSGARVLGDFSKSFRDAMKDIDKLAPKLGTLATGIGGITALGGSLVGWLGLVINQLGALGGLALPLPAMLIGGAAGMGVFIAALKDAGTVLEDVGERFGKLQDLISDNFWDQAEVPIREMVDNLMPMFREELGEMADALGAWTAKAADALGTDANSDRLAAIFQSTTKAIDHGSEGIQSWVDGFLKLGEFGSQYLPDMLGWFTDLGETFDNWVTTNVDNGNMFKWVEDGKQTFITLKDIIVDFFGIFSGIGDAAEKAGGGGIFTMAAGLDRLHAAVDSIEGQTGLTKFFTASKVASDQIFDGIGELLGSISQAMPTIEYLMINAGGVLKDVFGGIGEIIESSGFQDGIRGLIDGMGTFIGSLRDAAPQIGEILGAVGSVAGGLLESLGPSFEALIKAAEPLITSLAEGLMPVIDVIGDVLADLIEIITPLIEKFADGLAPILPIVADFFEDMWEKAKPLAEDLGGLLGAALDIIMPVLRDAAQTILPKVSDAFGKVTEALQPFIASFREFLEKHGPTIQKVLTWIVEFVGGALVEVIEGAAGVISGIWEVLRGGFELFAGIFTGDWSRMGEGLKSILGGIWEAIKGGFQIFLNVGVLGAAGKAFNFLKGIFTGGLGGIMTFLKNSLGYMENLWKVIWESIKKFLDWIFGGIKSSVDNFFLVLKAYIGNALQAIKTVWDNIWQGIFNFLKKIWDDIKLIASTGINGVKSVVDDVLRGLKKIWDDLWGGIKSAGKDAWDWISKTAGDVFTAMKDNVVNAVTKLRDGVSTVWNGIKEVVRKPINVVIKFVNDGIIGAYNWVAEKFGLKSLAVIPLLSATPNSGSSGGGGGGARPMTALKDGGFVNLPWNARERDPYLGMTPMGAFRFEGEEFFVKRDSTKKLEQKYPGYLDYLNKFGDLPGHALGGMTTLRGKRFSKVFAAILQSAEESLGKIFRITQGGFRPRTSYSGTSHQGDAVDIARPYGNADIAALRARGVAAWDRAGKGDWIDHIHGVPLPGYGSPAGSAVWQGESYLKGGDGLGGRDNGPRGGILEGIVNAVKAGFNSVKDWFSGILDKITGPFKKFTDSVGNSGFTGLIKAVASKLKDSLTDWVKDKLGIGGSYASGTLGAKRGISLVGENGPELIWMRGSEGVLDARRTAMLLKSAQRDYAAGPRGGYAESGIHIDQLILRMEIDGLQEIDDLRKLQKNFERLPRLIRQGIAPGRERN